MPLSLVTLPVRADNYVYLVHDDATRATAIVDVGDAQAVIAELDRRGWKLSEIWLTHHHPDHVEGTADLVAATGAHVTGAAADAHRLPALDRKVAGGGEFDFAGHRVEVIDVPGHAAAHVAYHLADLRAAFTADSLMTLGCGRVFEGTPAQMWESLLRIAALPDDTLICSGHEYTLGNGRFALTVDPGNSALRARVAAVERLRAEGLPTVPRTLGEEKATNPFLRPADPSIRAHLGMPGATDAEVFAEIRARKDRF